MKIANNTVVSLDYELRLNDDDDVIDSSGDEALTILIGHQNIIPGLENALIGLAEGDEKEIRVSPDQGYGVRDESKLIAVPKAALPPNFPLEVGVPLELEDEQGGSHPVWVAGVDGDDVVLDGNHPLADETLNFRVKVTGVRQATAQEIEHGHAHGAGGHHH